MTNREIAEILQQIGDMLDILGENRFKVIAYRRAAENILNLGRDIRSFWQAGTLREIPGIGAAIRSGIRAVCYSSAECIRSMSCCSFSDRSGACPARCATTSTRRRPRTWRNVF